MQLTNIIFKDYRMTSFRCIADIKIIYINLIYYEYITGIDYVLSLNNSRFGDYLHSIYPNEFEVQDTTDTQKSASSLDLHLEIDNG